MSQFDQAQMITLKAGEDLTNYLYRFVKFSSGLVVHCDTLGENAIGVLQAISGTSSGDAVTVAVIGARCKVQVAEALATVGTTIVPNVTTGKGINTGIIAGHYIGAKTLEAATGDGSIIECLLLNYLYGTS